MRKILRLIITVFVIGLLGYTIYFLMDNNNAYPGTIYESGNDWEDNPLFEINSGNQQGILGEKDSGNQNEVPSGNVNSGESQLENQFPSKVSGDTLEEKIASINLIETKNRLANLKKSLDDTVGVEMIGLKNKEFMESFEMNQMAVTVQVAGTMVYMIPAPDFVDNAQYHYDENGNLVLYICELTGIGGEIRYYFENGVCFKQEANIEENIEIPYESVEEILDRATLIYQRYMK